MIFDPTTADFRKVAVNVLLRPGVEGNELHALLRRRLGPRAGLPGTDFKVVFERWGEGYELAPLDDKRYAR